MDAENDQKNILDLKIITTKVSSNSGVQNAESDYAAFKNGALIITCAGGTVLEVRVLKPFRSSTAFISLPNEIIQYYKKGSRVHKASLHSDSLLILVASKYYCFHFIP